MFLQALVIQLASVARLRELSPPFYLAKSSLSSYLVHIALVKGFVGAALFFSVRVVFPLPAGHKAATIIVYSA